MSKSEKFALRQAIGSSRLETQQLNAELLTHSIVNNISIAELVKLSIKT